MPPLDDPDTAGCLLHGLHWGGAHVQVTALAERAAAHVALDNTNAVAYLLRKLREVGAEEQIAALAERAAAHVALHIPGAVAELMDSLRKVGAEEQATALAERLPAAGHFDRYIRINDHRERFRFGREPDGSAAAPWTWDDLE